MVKFGQYSAQRYCCSYCLDTVNCLGMLFQTVHLLKEFVLYISANLQASVFKLFTSTLCILTLFRKLGSSARNRSFKLTDFIVMIRNVHSSDRLEHSFVQSSSNILIFVSFLVYHGSCLQCSSNQSLYLQEHPIGHSFQLTPEDLKVRNVSDCLTYCYVNSLGKLICSISFLWNIHKRKTAISSNFQMFPFKTATTIMSKYLFTDQHILSLLIFVILKKVVQWQWYICFKI